MTPNERAQAIDEAIAAPKRVNVDGNSVETHSPKDVLDAIERSAANANAGNKQRGLKFAKMRSPGTV